MKDLPNSGGPPGSLTVLGQRKAQPRAFRQVIKLFHTGQSVCILAFMGHIINHNHTNCLCSTDAAIVNTQKQAWLCSKKTICGYCTLSFISFCVSQNIIPLQTSFNHSKMQENILSLPTTQKLVTGGFSPWAIVCRPLP